MSGSFTRDQKAGIDLLLVGDLNANNVARYVATLEAQEGRELTYAVLTREEFDYRRQIHDKFITTLLSSKLTVVQDTHNLLKQEL
jgi:hypothetical protein